MDWRDRLLGGGVFGGQIPLSEGDRKEILNEIWGITNNPYRPQPPRMSRGSGSSSNSHTYSKLTYPLQFDRVLTLFRTSAEET